MTDPTRDDARSVDAFNNAYCRPLGPLTERDAAYWDVRGLHPCAGCGLELDGDDTNHLCGECADAPALLERVRGVLDEHGSAVGTEARVLVRDLRGVIEGPAA